MSLENKANIIAHDLFKQHNGEKAVQTKKSLEKLKKAVRAEPNSRAQLKLLVAYKQRKTWWEYLIIFVTSCNINFILMNQIDLFQKEEGLKNNSMSKSKEKRPPGISVSKVYSNNQKWKECKIIGKNISIRSYSAACCLNNK